MSDDAEFYELAAHLLADHIGEHGNDGSAWSEYAMHGLLAYYREEPEAFRQLFESLERLNDRPTT